MDYDEERSVELTLVLLYDGTCFNDKRAVFFEQHDSYYAVRLLRIKTGPPDIEGIYDIVYLQ